MDVFVEKLVTLFGTYPLQFEPLMYVLAFVAFLWLCDGFFYLCRYLVGGGR